MDQAKIHDKWERERKAYGFKRRRTEPLISAAFQAAETRAMHSGEPVFRAEAIEAIRPIIIGGKMEDQAQMLQAINVELKESKKVMESLVNELTALDEQITPTLHEHITKLRANRMSAISEIRETLTALRELRKFFIESDYQLEITRLERFVGLCREMKELKDCGTLDAVCEAAIRLALQEK